MIVFPRRLRATQPPGQESLDALHRVVILLPARHRSPGKTHQPHIISSFLSYPFSFIFSAGNGATDGEQRRPAMGLLHELGLSHPATRLPSSHARGAVGHGASRTSSDYHTPATRRCPQGTLRCAQAAPPPSPSHARGTVVPPRDAAMAL
jgi:hypothetical protein